jgi:hypothetical protein
MDAYVINMHNDFMRQDSIKGFDNFAQYWLRSLEKIQKRLGLERYNALLKSEAMSIVKKFGATLKPQLKSALKSGGAVNAVSVCAVVAPLFLNFSTDVFTVTRQANFSGTLCL